MLRCEMGGGKFGLLPGAAWPPLTSTERTDNLRHSSTEGQKEVMPFELSILNWIWLLKEQDFSHKVISIKDKTLSV